MTKQHNPLASNTIIRWAWLTLAGVSIIIGTVGIVLPGIPTTPFLLVAAWAAPKGSPKLDHWLHTHDRFGPMIHGWHTQRAIPRSAKVMGISLMMISLVTLWWFKTPLWLWLTACVTFTCAGIVLALMKEPNYEELRVIIEERKNGALKKDEDS